MTKIIVKNQTIKTLSKGGVDYICITDIARQKNPIEPNGVIANWMRNRNTIEFLGIWEELYNPNFKPLEFEGFKKEAGLNAFYIVAYEMDRVNKCNWNESCLRTIWWNLCNF